MEEVAFANTENEKNDVKFAVAIKSANTGKTEYNVKTAEEARYAGTVFSKQGVKNAEEVAFANTTSWNRIAKYVMGNDFANPDKNHTTTIVKLLEIENSMVFALIVLSIYFLTTPEH